MNVFHCATLECCQVIFDLRAFHGMLPARATDAEEETMFVLGLGLQRASGFVTTIFSPENKTPSSFSFDAHAHVFERVAF